MALAEAAIPEWTLGDRLQKARDHAGLDQAAMAKIIGKSRPTISAWERDESAPRSKEFHDVIHTWADATGVDAAWIAGFRTGSFATTLTLLPSLGPDVDRPAHSDTRADLHVCTDSSQD